MDKRIRALTDLTLKGKMYVYGKETELSSFDKSKSRIENEAIQLCEYILNQEPKITEHSALTGRFNFNGQVVGDAFKRIGHTYTARALEKYYLKPQENLSTMEWQHATADYKKVLEKGIVGIIEEIDLSIKSHTDPEKIEFLNGLKMVASTLIKWSDKCANRVMEFAKGVKNQENRQRLEKLAQALMYVPKNKPRSFYEAVLTIYVCFSADPDSLGTLDRFLSPFYFNDIESGALTKEEAQQYLQELYLMVQASTHIDSVHFTRGGESHFCVGGYDKNGRDCFNELSRLIISSMVDLPTYIPQVTLRWTEKLSFDDFKYAMEYERLDPHKRIAFTNDEKRIKCYHELCGIPYDRAVSYTMVGCNEPAFLGAITGSSSKGNILKCIETLFHEKGDSIKDLSTYEEFYAEFEKELYSDLHKIFDYDNFYNLERAKDYNYISSLFFNGCIESGKSLTQGGGDVVVASPMLIGITNLIDALIVVKQFIYDEKCCTMEELISALRADWQGYELLYTKIIKTGKFFGNDDPVSLFVSQKLYNSLYNYYKNKKNVFGYPWLVGDLLGYNEHHKWFGENTRATPDGRKNKDRLKFGIGQSEGRDKQGLSALLNSVALLDKNAIGCGATVTNITLDEQVVKNDDSFLKLCKMLEHYFINGGVHFQLTYVSQNDLLCAQREPEKYKSLRVRVTGFSDYFVKLKPSIQNDIIERTVKK
ncbi:MAG: hypothetical protein J6B45_01455 [Clostridia bacterium]|nr:hypothetical protein [Clostridia bacterium]